MMRDFAALFACAVVASAVTASAGQEIPHSRFHHGSWVGSGFTHDETDRFSHCAVSANYRSGDTLTFSINADLSVSIGVSNPAFRLAPGQVMNVVVNIDRRAPFHGQAVAVDRTYAVLRIDEFERALQAIQKGYLMTISADGWRGRFRLTGTNRALAEARRCVRAHDDYRASGEVGSMTPAVADRSVEDAPAESGLLDQLATVMISEARADDFRYVAAEEKREFGLSEEAVYWASPSLGMLGGVAASILPAGTGLSELTVDDLYTIAPECAGDIVTETRSIQRAEYPGRELRAVCTSGSSETEMLLTRTMVGETRVDVFLLFSGSGTEDMAAPERRQMSEGIRIRTASFVADAAN